MTLQAWCKLTALASKLAAVQRRGSLLRALRAWAGLCRQYQAIRRKMAQLQARHWEHRLRELMAAWQWAATRKAILREAEEELRARVHLRALARAWWLLSSCVRVQQFERTAGQRKLKAALGAWHDIARRDGRARRVAAAAVARRLRETGLRALQV